MDWVMMLATLLSKEPLTPSELSAALFARGMIALVRKQDVEDQRLRNLEPSLLTYAALNPTPEELSLRLDEAADAVDDVDDARAQAAELSLAEVLNERDRWQVRATSLEAMGLIEPAHVVTEEIKKLDARLVEKKGALSAVAWMAHEQRAKACNATETIWARIPALTGEAPNTSPEQKSASAFSADELLDVVAGLAPSALIERIHQALNVNPELRTRFEELKRDFEEFKQEPDNIVHLPVRRMLGTIPEARRLSHASAAAATRALPRYDRPGVDALVHVFPDGAELYAQRDGERWVLFLACERSGTDDAFSGPALERMDEPPLLIATARPGNIQVRYQQTILNLALESLNACSP